jgi:hypothetical protein
LIEKPPRLARTRRDRKQMEDWLNDLLNGLLDAEGDDTDFEEYSELDLKEYLIKAAEHGDIEPLRKEYPELARFLHLPKQPGKGKRFVRDKFHDMMRSQFLIKLTAAAWDADRIRFIWKYEYKPMPKGYPPPEEIAAERWKVPVDQVYEWKMSRNCPKDPMKDILKNILKNILKKTAPT